MTKLNKCIAAVWQVALKISHLKRITPIKKDQSPIKEVKFLSNSFCNSINCPLIAAY